MHDRTPGTPSTVRVQFGHSPVPQYRPRRRWFCLSHRGAALAKDDYKFSTLAVEIVKSDPFRMRRGTR